MKEKEALEFKMNLNEMEVQDLNETIVKLNLKIEELEKINKQI